jgi:hypothetical protein
MQTASEKRDLLLIELNEVNYELLELAARTLPLKNLKKVLSFSHVKTHTDDVYDSGYLEPWVQWVSIHTGQPATRHRIKHLGDISNLTEPQTWEILSQFGITSGIWGVMNGSKRSAKNCSFFLCDPWTFGEQPYPNELSSLTNFAQYIAKNYLNLSGMQMAKHSVEYFFALVRYVGLREMLQASLLLLDGIAKFGMQNMVLGAFYEYTAAIAFNNQRKKTKPEFCVLFLNILAHIQHHYWLSPDTVSPQLRYGIETFDAILGKILAGSDCTVLIANGLSQVNTNADEPWILYRPKDHVQMFNSFGIKFENVEALMTHDGHVFFKTAELANQAFELLTQASVGTKPLFFVEHDPNSPVKLFYRLEFTDETGSDTTFSFGGKEFRFFEHFERVVLRTGKHCQDGFVLQSQKVMPDCIKNHEIHDYICAHFGAKNGETTSAEPHLPPATVNS